MTNLDFFQYEMKWDQAQFFFMSVLQELSDLGMLVLYIPNIKDQVWEVDCKGLDAFRNNLLGESSEKF